MILRGMLDLCWVIFKTVVDLFRPRAALEAEMLVLRQQRLLVVRGVTTLCLVRAGLGRRLL